MRSSWNTNDAKNIKDDPLSLRVYTSRLLGKEPSLVLHGGGNTSVKALVRDAFGDMQEVLYIKGSGWDLATIEAKGFAPVKLDALKRMAAFDTLSDTDMVSLQRSSMLDPNAPNPSVEAILHAIIPFKYVDHSHTDAVVAITNTPDGKRRIEELYGDNVLIVPYIMPGFLLAKKVYNLTRGLDWKKCQGIVLLNHGLFTFADSARDSYEQHIRLVSKAEDYIKQQRITIARKRSGGVDLDMLARLRQSVSNAQKAAVVAFWKDDPNSVGFAHLSNVSTIGTKGTLTPDHVIRTKPVPVVVGEDPRADVQRYTKNYASYFERNQTGGLKSLDQAPRWAICPKAGLVTFGRSYKDALITSDIVDHTVLAIQWAQGMGGWKVLSEKDIFEMEYWELEQAKLGKGDKPKALQGKVALVTGAYSGIGKAAVLALAAQGAHVAALDINRDITKAFNSSQILGLVCDVTKDKEVRQAVERTVRHFGGLDIVVSNAGIFPPSSNIENMDPKTWDKSIAINLTSHQRLMTESAKYLKYGIDPTIIIVASKNVPAPGPGASAYSVAKAGLTQLARVAALEMGGMGIRVNVLHPNQVFDTAIWTKEVLAKRAKSYGLSVEEYKTNNILKTEITSHHVADLIVTLAGPAFLKTTGAQIPIDGGNDRVI